MKTSKNNYSFNFRNYLLILLLLLISCSTLKEKETVNSKHKVHIVKISGFRFNPATLRIKKGDVVEWINVDIKPHQIVDLADRELQSDILRSGDWFSKSINFSKPYICSLHSYMQGKIVVINP